MTPTEEAAIRAGAARAKKLPTAWLRALGLEAAGAPPAELPAEDLATARALAEVRDQVRRAGVLLNQAVKNWAVARPKPDALAAGEHQELLRVLDASLAEVLDALNQTQAAITDRGLRRW